MKNAELAAMTRKRRSAVGNFKDHESVAKSLSKSNVALRDGNMHNARSRVDSHMPKHIMQATRGHEKDYVHDRGLHTGDGPDLRNVHAKVDDHIERHLLGATSSRRR